MKVLITGTRGIIGKWLANRLKSEGARVIGLDEKNNKVLDEHYICNILNIRRLIDVFRNCSPDIVVHLAARTDLDGDGVEDYACNTEGVKNIVDAVSSTPSVKRAIYTSSQLVCSLGYTPDGDTDYCPDTAYGKSKVLTERIVREYDGGGVTWCIVRPTTVWGPHMKEHYQRMIKYIESGIYFHVGKEKKYKSYAYAGNIAKQFYKLITVKSKKIKGKTIYLADYEPISLRDYADAYQKELGAPKIPTVPVKIARVLARTGDLIEKLGYSNFPFTSFRLGNILAEYTYDMSITKEICGPLDYSMRDGVKETVSWYKRIKS